MRVCAKPATLFRRTDNRTVSSMPRSLQTAYSGFEFRAVLLLDWLTTTTKEPDLM